ncbi:MAG: TRAP transporter substrate-binding protein [candidate division NC10 bacterium]|nr:TRAP transporter substrate-binding protein [candidate division NC10 bacterium]
MWMKSKGWLVAWTLLLVAVWCSPVAAQTVLKLGTQYSVKSPAVQAMQKFADYVKEKTDGKYVVRIFPDGQLGPDREMQQALKMGTLDLLHATNNAPTLMKEGRNFEATAAPYVFRTQEEYRKFLQTPIHHEMAAALEPGGSYLVGYAGDRPARALTTTNTPVRVPADMKGMKIRVPGMKAIMAFFQEVGANPTPMPLTELFTALKTGVVVGQDNGIDQVEASGFYEVQKYYMKLDHARGVYMLYAGTAKWKNWPESLKKVLIDGCKMAADLENQLLAEYEKVAYKSLQQNGMTILDVDQRSFEEIGKRVWKKFDGDLWEKGYMDRVQATLEQIRKTQ